MLIYYELIAAITIVYFIIKEKYPHINHAGIKTQGRPIFLLYSFIFIFLVMALRSPYVGTDTTHYLNVYTNQLYGKGIEVFTERSEWLFTIFQNFLSKFFSEQVYLGIIAAIITVSFGLFFLKYSGNLLVSVIAHITIGLFAFTLSGIRQSLAICIVLVAFRYALKNKPIPFIVMVGIAYLFHNSAICFLPVYLLTKIKYIDRQRCIIALSGILAVKLLYSVFFNLVRILAPQRYARWLTADGGLNYKSFILWGGILLLCVLLNFYEYKRFEGINATFFLMACITALVYLIAPNIHLFDRLGFYFIPFSIVLIANTITRMKSVATRQATVLIILAFCVFWFSVASSGGRMSIDNYLFFWQDDI